MTKDTCYFKPKIYCNMYLNLAKQFILHSAEAYSEPFLASKQKFIASLEVSILTKSSMLDVWECSEYVNTQEILKKKRTT